MTADRRASYVYDPTSDSERERIQARERKTRSRRAVALGQRQFPAVSVILDVGCGTGVVGYDLLQRLAGAHLIGVDIEPSILHTAKDKAPPNQRAQFVTGDAYRLPFGQEAFDLVACQYLLQHLSDPAAALKEMKRVCKASEQIIIFEHDDRADFSFPPRPPELEALFQAKAALIERHGGDRSIGRKLYHLLQAAGWSEIEVKVVHDTWQGPGDRRAALASAELSFLQLKSRMVDEGFIDLATFDEGIKQLFIYYQGEVFSVAFFFAGFARKPAGQ
jgi:ubiquinone/menaquinone biosynthesis C-methylase UbiE